MVVEIMFSGLIAFVRGSCEVTNAKTIQAVMVQGKMQEHQPRLVVDVLDLVPPGPNDVIPDEIIQLPDGPQLAVFSLENRQIEVWKAPHIQIVEGTRDYSVAYPDKSGSSGRNRPEDFSWAPELDHACFLDDKSNEEGNERYARAKVLNPRKHRGFSLSRLAPITVDATDGKTTNLLEAAFDDDVEKQLVYAFPNAQDKYQQVLADRAKLTMTIAEAHEVEIRVRKQGKKGDSSFKSIHLKLRDKATKVSISISNLPSKVEAEAKTENTELHHFNEYYRLLNYTKPKNCPTPVGTAVGGIQPVKCAICSTCGVP